MKTGSKPFKVGDEVICFRDNAIIEYKEMKGVITGKDLNRDLWEVDILQCPIYGDTHTWVLDDRALE